jgi:hypothetical protein
MVSPLIVACNSRRSSRTISSLAGNGKIFSVIAILRSDCVDERASQVGGHTRASRQGSKRLSMLGLMLIAYSHPFALVGTRQNFVFVGHV